jgi:hypothetical protein
MVSLCCREFQRWVVQISPSSVVFRRISDIRQASEQVHHQRASQAELLDLGGLGRCSVTVMIRTGLFPHNRSRLRNTTPSPVGFFKTVASAFLHSLSAEVWSLPTLADCQLIVPEAQAATPTPVHEEPPRQDRAEGSVGKPRAKVRVPSKGSASRARLAGPAMKKRRAR